MLQGEGGRARVRVRVGVRVRFRVRVEVRERGCAHLPRCGCTRVGSLVSDRISS